MKVVYITKTNNIWYRNSNIKCIIYIATMLQELFNTTKHNNIPLFYSVKIYRLTKYFWSQTLRNMFYDGILQKKYLI